MDGEEVAKRSSKGKNGLNRSIEEAASEMSNFFDISLDLFCIADPDGRFLKVNKEWENTLGYSAGELEHTKFTDFVHPDDMVETMHVVTRLMNNERILNFVNRFRTKEGSYKYIEWRAQPHKERIYIAARDITDRKQTEDALLQSEARFQIALKATRSSLWEWNRMENRYFSIPNWEKYLGYEENEFKDMQELKTLWHPDDADRVEQSLNGYADGKLESLEVDYRMRCKNGDWLWTLTRGNAFRDPKGKLIRIVGTHIDITQLKKAESEVLFLSFHDQLTGLYNRRFYTEEIKRLDTARNLPFSLIMADVNGLKLVNDSFGHLAGDKMLVRIAQIFKEECRNDDIIARIGGDEFVMLLPKTGPDSARSLIVRLNTAIANAVPETVNLSVAIGWATKTSAEQNMEEVFRKAEDSMYQRKMHENRGIKEKTIRTVMETLFETVPFENQHAARVSRICEILSRKMTFQEERINEMKIAGRMHDIGKISLDRGILTKPDRLNEEEWKEVRRHPETGYRILNSINELSHTAIYILHHHEHWNGSGYPFGLKKDEIPLQSRIIAVADAYATMTSDRPYGKAVSGDTATAEIRKGAGTQFDPGIVRVLEDIADKL